MEPVRESVSMAEQSIGAVLGEITTSSIFSDLDRLLTGGWVFCVMQPGRWCRQQSFKEWIQKLQTLFTYNSNLYLIRPQRKH